MKFAIGDEVAVLDDVLKGIVITVSSNLIVIKDINGMLYEFLPSELVKIEKKQELLSRFSDINHPLLQEKIAEKQKLKSFFVKEKNEVIMEIDLHISQLTSSIKGLDNYDILSLQLDTAKRKLEFCIKKRISKIVFIHGVGSGVLKAELHCLLEKYMVKYYDASYQKYGLGATEVYVFQNIK